MWHLKTKLGTFWVVETNNELQHGYFLGVNDQELGVYNEVDQAAKDVYEQTTGYLTWDCQARVKAPNSINQWVEGAPDDWQAKNNP